MTQDAINYANSIQATISSIQKDRSLLLAKINANIQHLSAADQKSVIDNINSIHDAMIAAQQAILANISPDYVAPAPASTKPIANFTIKSS